MSLEPGIHRKACSERVSPTVYLCVFTPGQNGSRPYHEEGVADPEAAPAQRALWDGDVLAVHSNGLRGCLTHRAAADVLGNLGLPHRHHGNGGSRGEPVGFIIASGVVAHFIDVAVDEWHGAESGQAGASKPWEEKMGKDRISGGQRAGAQGLSS